jgi:hypothetical protein
MPTSQCYDGACLFLPCYEPLDSSENTYAKNISDVAAPMFITAPVQDLAIKYEHYIFLKVVVVLLCMKAISMQNWHSR